MFLKYVCASVRFLRSRRHDIIFEALVCDHTYIKIGRCNVMGYDLLYDSKFQAQRH